MQFPQIWHLSIWRIFYLHFQIQGWWKRTFRMRGSGPSRLSPSFLIHSFVSPVSCWQTFVSMGGYYGLFHKTLGSRLQTDMLEGKQKLEFLLFCGSIDALQLWQTCYRDMTSINHQQRSVSAHPEVSDSSGGAECCPLSSLSCNTSSWLLDCCRS